MQRTPSQSVADASAVPRSQARWALEMCSGDTEQAVLLLAVGGCAPPDSSSEPAAALVRSRSQVYREVLAEEAELVCEALGAPEACTCPITMQVMQDPVICEDGYTYEREAVEAWLQEHGRSPMTNQQLVSTRLIPNRALRGMIELWREGLQGALSETLQHRRSLLSQLTEPPSAAEKDSSAAVEAGGVRSDRFEDLTKQAWAWHDVPDVAAQPAREAGTTTGASTGAAGEELERQCTRSWSDCAVALERFCASRRHVE